MTSRASIWTATSRLPEFGPLTGDVDCDVAVVGAGITGLTCARLLERSGKRVVVLERGRIGSGVSGRTTAHLATVPDCGYEEIEKKFGKAAARLVAADLKRAVTLIERLAAEIEGDCSFARLPGYYYAAKPEHEDQVRSEAAAAERAGLIVELSQHVPLPFKPSLAAKFPDQGRFHILQYLGGLSALLRERGVAIHELSQVDSFEAGEPCTLRTARGTVHARDIVMATHSPLGVSPVQTEMGPFRSYVLAGKLKNPIEDALYWDTCSPYNYIRLQPSGSDMLAIIGGQDHKTGHDSETDADERLERWAREHFDLDGTPLRWSAQVFESADGLPFIGKAPGQEHVYMATGFSGDGMTFGTISAEIVTHLLLGRPDPSAELFAPSRLKSVSQVLHAVKENIDVAKRFVLDRLTGDDKSALDELPPGGGCVVTQDHHKVAAYRDDGGRLFLMSAVCPHMKCIVRFNPAERTWDCPCHGSRFSAQGEPLEAPTLSGLERLPSE